MAFSMPFGGFQYLVLPCDISPASEIWQRAMVTEFRTYVGHVISAGLSPSPVRIQSILEWHSQQAKASLRPFLGMITYIGKFIPNLSEITALLRQLTEKQVAWHWDGKYAKAMETLKRIITSAAVLKLYDVNKPVSLATDASKHRFGAVLIHDENRPMTSW